MGRLAAILVLISAWGCALAGQVEVRAARLSDEGDKTRLVFDLGGDFTHKAFTLQNPDRLVIDIPDAALRCKLPMAAGDHPFLEGLRSGIREGDDLRMVFDLSRPVRPKTFQEKPADGAGHRLVVELRPTGAPPASDKGVAKSGPAKSPTTRAKGDKTRDLVIAIDAGHGGKDAGAIGAKRTKEKDVTLAVARRLARLVDQAPGMRAYLTRDGDYFVALRQRMAKARKQKADLFVSIHADAFDDPGVAGSSVYTLSTRGATSEAARWLADRENAADLVGGVKLDDGDGLLASVLLDMSQNATMEQSAVAAQMVLDKLSGLGGVHSQRVQRAGFMVLKSPDVPSMLVETAYISNPAEEARLRDPKHQHRLAEAILQGIRAYFKKYPVPGMAIAADSRTDGKGRAVAAR